MTPTSRKVYAANDTPIQVEGKLQLPFFLGEQCIWTDALVSEDIEEVMLGIDWLKQNEYGISEPENSPLWDGRQLH